MYFTTESGNQIPRNSWSVRCPDSSFANWRPDPKTIIVNSVYWIFDLRLISKIAKAFVASALCWHSSRSFKANHKDICICDTWSDLVRHDIFMWDMSFWCDQAQTASADFCTRIWSPVPFLPWNSLNKNVLWCWECESCRIQYTMSRVETGTRGTKT